MALESNILCDLIDERKDQFKMSYNNIFDSTVALLPMGRSKYGIHVLLIGYRHTILFALVVLLFTQMS